MLEKSCLAIEITGDEIRAVVVGKKSRKFNIWDYVALQRTNPGDDLPAIELLKDVKIRLGYKKRQAVFTGSVARQLEILMNREKVLGLNDFQLRESVKWEVEPYTGINGAMALTGVKIPDTKPILGEIIEESDEINVNVSVIEQNIYRALKERFKAAGMDLIRVYPPETCFFEVIRNNHPEADRAVFEICDDHSNFALIKGGTVKFINTLNITTELLKDHIHQINSPDLEDTLNSLFIQAPKPYPISVTGSGALDGEIISFLSQMSDNKIEPVVIKRSAGLTGSGIEEGPVFATAAGAAILELKGKKEKFAGISDHIPVLVTIKRSAYLTPLLLTVILFVSLLFHNRYMVVKEKHLKKQISEYKKELKVNAGKNEKLQRLKNQLGLIDEESAKLLLRKKFLESEADKNLSELIKNLKVISDCIPDTSGLCSLETLGKQNINKIKITGISAVASNPYGYSAAIQKKLEMKAKVLSIKKIEKTLQGTRYIFEMEIGL